MDETMILDRLNNQVKVGVIDCDIHNTVPSIKALFPYLPERWRDYLLEHNIKSLEPNYYPKHASIFIRPDAVSDSGNPPGSDLDLLRKLALDPWNVKYAILNCLYGIQMIHNEDLAVVMARAVNDWIIAEWLDKEPRLRASIVVPSQNPLRAAEEIHRLGHHPGFVQVLLLVRSEKPYGKRYYWPIYEAAEQYGLTIGIHAGGMTGYPIMPVGWPSHYIEDYVSQSQAFQSQLISLVSEGVFKKFPSLKVVMMESGFTWMPALMWRFDKNWKGLRREVPWVDRLPSEIIRDHIRLTVQPVDEAPEPDHLFETMQQLDSEDMLLFSTDYPHWHFDKKDDALPIPLPANYKEKLFSKNALSVYRF